MLEQIVAAPFAMIRRPSLYVIAFILAFLQGAVTLLLIDYQTVFQATLLDAQPLFSIEFFIGLVVFLVSGAIPLYLHAILSQRINSPAKGTKTAPMGLVGSCIALSIVIAVVGIAALLVAVAISAAIGTTTGIVSIILMILFALIAGIILFAVVKFMFTPSFLGRGFSIKEAFAESWKLTAGKFFSVLVIALVILIVGGFLAGITALLPVPTDNQWVALFISSIFSGLTGYFSGTLLALIVGNDTNLPTSGARHPHKK